jgi:ectoine hydroxylase-related dioxygenase (phytanoyl-CoA dioxygenase family)
MKEVNSRLLEVCVPEVLENEDGVEKVSALVASRGAIILRSVIRRNDVQALKSALVQALQQDNERYGQEYVFKGMVHALMARGKPFCDLLGNRALLAIMRAILGPGCIIHAYNSSSMPPHHTNYSRTIHVDCPRLIHGYITNMGLTLALDAFTSDNGAMQIASLLFDRANRPDETDFESQMIILDNLEPGDAVLFNARCWHRGGLNRTDHWRHAVTMNVCRAYMRQQFDFPRMLNADVVSGLSEDVKRFLGFYVRMPVSMEEFLLPADQRPYRPGQE